MLENKEKEITVIKALKMSESALARAGITEARVEAEWILADVLSVKRYELFLSPQRILSRDERRVLDSIIKRRVCREPLAYITGKADFRGFAIEVSEATLIPRPETELLIDEGLSLLNKKAGPIRVLEPCTGSGCISVALGAEFCGELIKSIALDISSEALLVARHNATRNNVADKISFLCGDLLRPIKTEPFFDLVVCNPPYIRSQDMDNLQAEVRLYEPRLALDGGTEGMDYIKRLIEGSASVLRKGGSILLELGIAQAVTASEYARSIGKFQDIHIIKDLSGIDRFFSARKE